MDTNVYLQQCRNSTFKQFFTAFVLIYLPLFRTIGVVVRMSTLDTNVDGSIPASICFLLEQETLSALLQSTQL